MPCTAHDQMIIKIKMKAIVILLIIKIILN